MKQYKIMTDEQLIRKAREGESMVVDFIIDKYKPLVKKKAKAMFLLGGENDDLIQEGMIGLFKAIRDFDLEKDISFASFADLCVSRQMYTAIKLSQRQKHMPLNTYVSLYEQVNSDSEDKQTTLIEQLETSQDNNPEEVFLDKEWEEAMEQALEEKLSEFERRVLHLHLIGEDYRSIAKLLDKTPKSIDNALQRIKQKTFDILTNLL
jgi:RNA polymerase sporulation-specific sigma factor